MAQAAPPAAAPALSVIVCTHARPGYLAACLAGLAAQAGTDGGAPPAFETLVVDSASPEPAAAQIRALAEAHGARLLVADRPGLSTARNLGAGSAGAEWLAYIDDDAVPDPDWAAAILRAAARDPRPAAIGGLIRPRFEAPLPGWWPPSAIGALTVIEHTVSGDVGHGLPGGIEPYGANFIVARAALAAIGGFPEGLGRIGTRLLSGEEILVLRRIAARGGRIRYDPAIAVTHAIQAGRLSAAWLIERQYWQGVSDVTLRRLMGEGPAVWARAPRRLAALLAFGPWLLLTPRQSPARIGARIKAAFSAGYLAGLLRPPG